MSASASSRPGSSSMPVPSGSPRSSRSTGDRNVLTSNRTEIGREMNTEMLVCPIKSFQDAYLPFVPTEHDVSTCLQRLTESSLLVPDSTGTLQWKGFPKSPFSDDRPEVKIFSALKQIADELAKYTFPLDETPGRQATPHVSYRDCPNTPLASEIKGANFRIDGCFELNKKSELFSSPKLVAPDTVVVAEYKKDHADRIDNRLKLSSAASHIMNDDPRRAFMFGHQITIEDTMMSLWYFSRSHSTKSEPFDFIKNPGLLISTFLSFLFGNEEKLGYDQAVRRCTGTPIHYEYEITGEHDKRYYRTCGVLSSYRSLGITGRMTRVWRAVQISGFGGAIVSEKEVALKDVWLDVDARTEYSIQQEIFKAVDFERQKYDGNQESRLDLIKSWELSIRGSVFDIIHDGNYRKYFLEINFDGQGVATKDKPSDVTPTLGLFTPNQKKSVNSRSQQITGSDPGRSKGSPIHSYDLKSEPDVDHAVYENRRYLPKRRYLLVFTDICTALHDATDLETSFSVLNDAWIALAVMFVADWVHRDVSSGNILFLGEGQNAQGKLSDLEYAKPFMSESLHSADPKTGTPFFMAYELLIRSPLYTPEARKPPRDSKGMLARAMRHRNIPGLEASPGHSPPPIPTATPIPNSSRPVIYNFQHDLESLWWIALWILLARVSHETSQRYAKKVYINKLECSAERILVFTKANHLVSKLKVVLHSKLFSFIGTLDNCRVSLNSSYVTREKEEKEGDPHAYSDIYVDIMIDLGNCFGAACEVQGLPSLVNLHPRPPPIPEASPTEPTASRTPAAGPNPGKRARSTSADEADAEQNESPPLKVARTTDQQESLDLDLRPDRRLLNHEFQ